MLAGRRESMNKEQLTIQSSRSCDRSNVADYIKTSDKLNSLVEQQVDIIKESQIRLQNIVEDIDLHDHKVDLNTVESIKNIVRKSEDLIILVKIIIKVRNELGHARLDLEKLRKSDQMIDKGKKRVQWLEQKLQKLLIDCYEQSSGLLNSTKYAVPKGVNLKDTCYKSFLQHKLSSAQCKRIFCDVGGYTEAHEDNMRQKYFDMVIGVVGASQKMVPDQEIIPLDEVEVSDETLLNDKDVSVERVPSAEEQFAEDERYMIDAEDEEQPFETLKEPTSKNDLYLNQTTEESSEDEVDKYWKSDHHKFEWAEDHQRDPISWHVLGISVQDSFISKEKPKFSEDLPWVEKTTQVNSVLDIHKIALDKLYVKLHQVYDEIEKATTASINPTFKNDKIETRMGNIESKQSFTDPRVNSQDFGGMTMQEEKNHEGSLPTLSAKSSYLKITQDHKSRNTNLFLPMVKTPGLCWPRSPSVWCSSQSWKGRIVKKITTNRPARQNKTVFSKKFDKQVKVKQTSEERRMMDAMVWRPSIIYKMIRATKVLKVFQTQVQQWDTARRSGPKWKRVNWLLGKSGLQSATNDIVINALKTLGELRCSEVEVGEAVKNLIITRQDPRIIYEASKTLILSGHWDPMAIKMLLSSLKCGTKGLKVEILDALISVTDIPFFENETQLSKQLKSCLVDMVQGNDPRLAFSSALCLGKVCIANPVAKKYLMKVVQSEGLSSKEKGQALHLLVRDMGCKDDVIVRALLHELNTSINWKIRVEAADLLIYLGEQHVVRAENPEKIFVILDRLLWDHAHQDVRSKVAELLNTLKLRQKACDLVIKRLDDPEASVRGRASISLATLEMKGGKELKALLDILALDYSVYARVQAVRAFSKLTWNDPRVLRCLREREKGEGILAKEARKAIKQILEPDKRSKS